MNKTKIDWCDMSWNPVTGCMHGCEYCYARGIANRFKDTDYLRGGLEFPGEINAGYYTMQYGCEVKGGIAKLYEINEPRTVDGKYKAYPFNFRPTLHRYRLNEPQKTKMPKNIFVCSMADLFGEWVPDEWIKTVFDATNKAPQHNYLYLTKNPERYFQLAEGDGAIVPDDGVSGWFGASACTEEQAQEAWENLNCTWISLEPLMGEFSEEFYIHDNRYTQTDERRWSWVVVGAETGNLKSKVIPERTWIEEIVRNCRDTKTPLFMKGSLADFWGEALIQEYPW